MEEIYFDNAATTRTDPEVAALMTHVLCEESVSYTHLDVYKRQSSFCPGPSPISITRASAGPAPKTTLRRSSQSRQPLQSFIDAASC